MTIRVRLSDWKVGSIDSPRPIITLRVRSRFGDFVNIRFAVDTGADLTTIPTWLAEDLGIPFRRITPGTAVGLLGSVAKYRDSAHFRIAGREYDWPCDFIQSPRPPSGEGRGPISTEVLPVLGRAGLQKEFAVCTDDEYLTITRLGPWRRWWRWFWRRFGWGTAVERSARQPL
jgi:hypothetical protein